MKRSLGTICLCLFFCIALTKSLIAQLPTAQLTSLFPAGAKQDSTVKITISGNNLDDTDELIFAHEGISATRIMAEPSAFDKEPQPVANEFQVTVRSDVPPANYSVRSRGKYGLSNPRTFVVGTSTEIIEAEPNGGNEFPGWIQSENADTKSNDQNPALEITLPACVSGQSGSGADVDWFRFRGSAGQTILIDGYARRIDSQMDLVTTLFDATGTIINEGRRTACGDPLISETLPSDGEYFLKVHDALYRNGDNYHYRINLGSQPHIDFIFPPAGMSGSNASYTVYGYGLPGGTKSGLIVNRFELEKLTVQIPIPADLGDRLECTGLVEPHQAGMDGIEFRVTNNGKESNAALITSATAPVVIEQANNDTPDTAQKLTLPCEVAGQFFPQRDVDWFTIDCKQDETWAIEVISQRLGLVTDPSILIQQVTIDDQGETQTKDLHFIDDVQSTESNTDRAGRHEFDSRTSDPELLFQAPADGTYRILVKDGVSSVKRNPRLIYRLAIRKPAPDFRIAAVPAISSGSFLLRRDGRQTIRVVAFRKDGYDGEIVVQCDGLPAGVHCDPITIGPGSKTGRLVLTASSDAAPSISTLNVSARGVIDGSEVSRNARYGTALETFQFSSANANIPSVRSRLVDQIKLCVTDYDPAPNKLTIGDGKRLETSRGGNLKIPFNVKKAEGSSGNLNAVVIDLPPRASASQVNIGDKEEGEFEIRFSAQTPPGTYSFYLAGFNQGFRYSRNPEAAEKAKLRQERIAKIYNEAQNTTRQAQQVANQSQTLLQNTTSKLNQIKASKLKADQAAEKAEIEWKKAKEAQDKAQKAITSNPDDESLKAAMSQTQTAFDQAVQKRQQTEQDVARELNNLQQAVMEERIAQATKKEADESYEAAKQFEQQAQREKQRADQFATQKKNESNPRNTNINVPSNSLTVTVAEFPIKIEKLAPEVTLKQGDKLPVPIRLERLYDFQANVSVQTRLPSGVSGITFQSITIPGDKPDGQFEINSQPTATIGQHLCTIRLQMNFNGQNLTMEHPLTINVLEAEVSK
jgi:hypothetical protein